MTRVSLQHVERYLRGVEEALHSSALEKRVRDWRKKIEPALAEEEARTPFDIHLCGEQVTSRLSEVRLGGGGFNQWHSWNQSCQLWNAILCSPYEGCLLSHEACIERRRSPSPPRFHVLISVASGLRLSSFALTCVCRAGEVSGVVCVCVDEHGEGKQGCLHVCVCVFICVQEQAAQGDEEEAFGFEVAVQGCARHDVCRAFLATLQLANDGNVEIGLVVLPLPFSLPHSLCLCHPSTLGLKQVDGNRLLEQWGNSR